MIPIKSKIKIAFPTLLCLVLLFFFTDKVMLCAVISATIVHELGHVLGAILTKIKISRFSVDFLGARIDTGHALISYTDEIILSAAGPFFNIISSIAFYNSTIPFFAYFTSASFSLACLNLLPIETFDGGRVLYCFLSKILSNDSAALLIRALSFICLFVLWCISVYFLIRSSSSLSLFVFSLSIFNRLFLTNKENL